MVIKINESPLKHLFLLLTCLLLPLCSLWSQCNTQTAVVTVPHTLLKLDLSAYTCLYVDQSGKMGVEAVKNAIGQGYSTTFRQYEPEGRFQRGRYAYWLHFNLCTSSQDTLDRLLFCGAKDTFDLYIFANNRLISHQKAGRGKSAMTAPDRWFLLGKHLFPLTLAPGDTLSYLLRVRSVPMIEWDFEPTLFAPFHFAEITAPKLFRYYLINGVVLGFLCFGLVFGAAQYVQRKSKAALFYLLYLFTITVLLARVFYIRDYFFYPIPHDLFRYYYNLPLNYTNYILYFLFVKYFLDTPNTFTFLNRYLNWSARAFGVAFLVHWPIIYCDEWLALKVGYFWRLLFVLASFYMAYLALLQIRNPLYKFTLAGSGALLLSLVISMAISWVPNNIVGFWWDIADIPVLVGLIIEIVCFTLGLAYKKRIAEIEKSQAEAALQIEHNETLRLQEMDQAKTRLFANITHEFRTPLTIIGGMAAQIAQDPGRWAKEGAEMIRRNGAQLLRLVKQMLNLSKLESGALPLRLVHKDVVGYLAYLCESLHSLAAAKGVSLTYESNVETCEMDYDPDSLEQIIQNLLSNAVRHTAEGGKIWVRLAVSEPELIVQVEDSGEGIPAKQLPFIFDRFYQAAHGEHSKKGGVGLGLALVKEWVKLLRGTITVNSVINQGTVFTVLLPLQQAEMPAAPLEVPSPKTIALEASISRTELPQPLVQSDLSDLPVVLVVEDNPDMLRYLKICLSPHYQVIEACDGNSGLSQALEHTPDLIVSDVMMPEMDGFQLCDALKKNPHSSHIPFILLSAKADIASRIEGLTHGADVYLPKPFDAQELNLQLKNLLALRNTLQSYYKAIPARATTALKGPKGNPAETQFLTALRNLVLDHLDDPQLDIPFLCKKQGISKSGLHRKLSALTGEGANHFILNVRMEKARDHLLADFNCKIATVAYTCGFNDPDYFAKVFKERYGQSPSEWREMR